MELVTLTTQYRIYKYPSELSAGDIEILEVASRMLDHAYAPYSGFHVGAGVRLVDGKIYPGSNQENASYPLCMCGERVALYNASANSPGIALETLAIVVRNPKKAVLVPASPCGACRQVISEYENRYGQPIRILLKAESDKVFELRSVAELLPLGFNDSYL
jgi:cytidine deaminase